MGERFRFLFCKNVNHKFLKIVLKAENWRQEGTSWKMSKETATGTAGCLWRLFIDVSSISLLTVFLNINFFRK